MSKKIEVIVSDKNGLHGAKCVSLVKEANKYISNISLSHNGKIIDIKSILGLMSLCINGGQNVIITADGIDAQEAILNISNLVA